MTESQIEQIISYILIGIAIVPAIIISIIHENKRDKRPEMVNTKPYTWGYYNGWFATILGSELIAISLFSLSVGETDTAIFLLIGGGLMALGFGVIKRNALAWILFIIVSFNPVSWIINGIYLKNRWSEFNDRDDAREIQCDNPNPPPLHYKTPPPLPTQRDILVMKNG